MRHSLNFPWSHQYLTAKVYNTLGPDGLQGGGSSMST